MSGAGKGTMFLTIKNSFETDNCNGYKDYNFDELEDDIRKSEYYIQPIKKFDTKLKNLYDELKIKDFEIDTDEILKNFWESQRNNIKKLTNFINDFFHPYLIEYKNTLPVEDMVKWDSYYKKAMHTKNNYIFAIPHDVLNIIVYQGTTHITVYITAPFMYGKYDPKHKRGNSILAVFEMATKYSDDIYIDKMTELTKAIIDCFEESLKKGFYEIHPSYKLIDAVEHYEQFLIKGDYNDWQIPIPGNYTYVLREFNYIKHYAINKGFE